MSLFVNNDSKYLVLTLKKIFAISPNGEENVKKRTGVKNTFTKFFSCSQFIHKVPVFYYLNMDFSSCVISFSVSCHIVAQK